MNEIICLLQLIDTPTMQPFNLGKPLYLIFKTVYATMLSTKSGLQKERQMDTVFGKVIIEYKNGNNVIQVCNTMDVCSLVINDKVVDAYVGLVMPRVVLKGKIQDGDKEIPVQAKMGFIFMRLYYNGAKVATKFMGIN